MRQKLKSRRDGLVEEIQSVYWFSQELVEIQLQFQSLDDFFESPLEIDVGWVNAAYEGTYLSRFDNLYLLGSEGLSIVTVEE